MQTGEDIASPNQIRMKSPEPSQVVYPTAPLATRLLAVLLGFIVPGAGHLVLGKVGRGLMFLLTVTAMFAIGVGMQGHLFTPTGNNDWLAAFFSFFDLGLGLSYLICYGGGFLTHAVSVAPSFEYGNTFLMVAGLLNYLIVMDAWDIGVGRKA